MTHFLVISRIFKSESIRTIIDGGASIGETSLRFLTLFPESKVYMFEPYSGFKQYLEEKKNPFTQISSTNLVLYPIANHIRFLQINKSKGTNSILHGDSVGKEIYGSQFKMWRRKIKCITLDLWFNYKEINSIDILKLDVQGTEIDVLEGAKIYFQKI